MRLALVALVILFAAATCGSPSLPAPRPTEVDAVVVVLDLSPSGTVTPAQRCDEAIARGRAAWSASAADAVDLFVLGVTGAEPLPLLGWTRLADEAVLFGSSADASAARDARLGQLRHLCSAAARTTEGSAIYLATARALDALRAHCDELMSAGAHCGTRTIHLHTDGWETVRQDLRARLAAAARPVPRRQAALPPVAPLPTGGVHATFCSSVETTGDEVSPRAGAARTDAVYQAWAGVLGGAMPPAIDPSCPR